MKGLGDKTPHGAVVRPTEMADVPAGAVGRPTVVLLVGPTAVGKTQIAVQLAQILEAEIVSLDSRAFYRGMDIGTAKPGSHDRQAVPHHLIDIADPDQTISLAQFQRLAETAIDGILSRGRLPLLVGGTGQYVRALTSGWAPPKVPPNTGLRRALEHGAQQRGADWLHDRLSSLDPAAAARIDTRNVRRTVRALEVILSTGRRFSEQRGTSTGRYHVLIFGLRRLRTDLYARIDARVDEMWRRGLLQETRALLDRGYSEDLPAMSAIGYAQCVRVLRGLCSQEEAIREMRRLTRAFVRRQANWFRETDPQIAWFDAGTQDIAEVIAAVVRQRLAVPHLGMDSQRSANAD